MMSTTTLNPRLSVADNSQQARPGRDLGNVESGPNSISLNSIPLNSEDGTVGEASELASEVFTNADGANMLPFAPPGPHGGEPVGILDGPAAETEPPGAEEGRTDVHAQYPFETAIGGEGTHVCVAPALVPERGARRGLKALPEPVFAVGKTVTRAVYANAAWMVLLAVALGVLVSWAEVVRDSELPAVLVGWAAFWPAIKLAVGIAFMPASYLYRIVVVIACFACVLAVCTTVGAIAVALTDRRPVVLSSRADDVTARMIVDMVDQAEDLDDLPAPGRNGKYSKPGISECGAWVSREARMHLGAEALSTLARSDPSSLRLVRQAVISVLETKKDLRRVDYVRIFEEACVYTFVPSQREVLGRRFLASREVRARINTVHGEYYDVEAESTQLYLAMRRFHVPHWFAIRVSPPEVAMPAIQAKPVACVTPKK